MHNDDLPAKLLASLNDRIPLALQPWGQAMLSELTAIEGFWSRLRWSLGGAGALTRAWLRHVFARCTGGEERRVDVSLIAGYHFLFSATLIGLITWQLPRITEPWKNAVPSLVICYAVAALPGVSGLGLVLRDEAARIGTIMLTIVHLLLNIEYLRRGMAPIPELTKVRIAADFLIIILLMRRPVRRHFQISPLALRLGDHEPAQSEHSITTSKDSTMRKENKSIRHFVWLAALVGASIRASAQNGVHSQGRNPADSVAENTAAIIALEQRDAAAAKINDVETLVSLWTPDGVLLQPKAKPVEGIAAIRQLLEAQKQQAVMITTLGYEEHWKERRILGNEAYEWGEMTVTVKLPNGKEVTQTVFAIRILRRDQDGSWKFARAAITPGPLQN